MERDLFVEEIRKNVNSKFNPKPNEYQTAAPIIGETNAPNMYLTVSDMEKIKFSIESYSRDYSTQFNNLITYIDRVSDQYAALIAKIDSLKEYIENLQNTVNSNKGKINSVEVEDITYYTRRDEDSYYQKELMPKLSSLYEKSIAYATSLIDNQIVSIVSEIYETNVGKEIITEEFLKSINYYQHFNSLVDSSEAFRIEKARLSTGEIEDKGTVQILRTDPSKFSKIKGLTKGNDILEVTVAGTNKNAGGLIIEGVGKLSNQNFSVKGLPFIPDLFKSDIKSLKNSWVSDVFSHMTENELESYTNSVLYELETLLNISLDSNSLFIKNGSTIITNSKNGKVYVNKVQADFSVSSIKVLNGSVCVVSTAGDLWVVGSNYNNRLGLGKSIDSVSDWRKAKFSDTREGKVEDVWIYDKITLLRTSKNEFFISGTTQICNNDTKENFHLIGKYNRFEYYENTLYLFSDDSSELFACGENYYGECGVDSEKDFIINPTKIDIDGINSHTFLTMNEKSVFLFIASKYSSNIYSLYGFGRNDHIQLGFINSFVSKPKLIATDINSLKSRPELGFIIDKNKDLFVFGDNFDNRLGISGNKRNICLTLLYSIDEDNLLGLKNNVDAVYSKNNNTFVVTEDGNLYVCGNNKYGILGTGDEEPVTKIKLLNNSNVLGKVDYMTLGKDFAILFTRAENYESNNDAINTYDYKNRILVSGNNKDGILGLPDIKLNVFTDIGFGASKYIPIYYNGNLIFRNIANSIYHGAGLNQFGQLGTGSIGKQNSFFKIPVNKIDLLVLRDVTYILSNGEVYGAGLNTSGQIGIDSTENNIPTFTKIEGLKNIKWMYTDGITGYFIDTNNDLFVVGANYASKAGVESNNDKIIRTPEEAGFSITQMSNAAKITDNLTVLEQEIEEQIEVEE